MENVKSSEFSFDLEYATGSDLIDFVDRLSREFVSRNFKRWRAEDCGLDPRSGVLYVADDDTAIAVHRVAARLLDYYGGFEYVADECRNVIGEFVFYSCDDGRVADAICCLRDNIQNKGVTPF
jgi:hypothetical protein